MNIYGICISDKNEYYLIVTLQDILSEISEGEKYTWAILFLDGITKKSQEITIVELKEAIKNSNSCLIMNWKELFELSNVFYQLYDATIIGCLDYKNIQKYRTEELMYKSCDIVIELIDSNFWEVRSKDPNLIKRYSSKFKETKPLEISYAS